MPLEGSAAQDADKGAPAAVVMYRLLAAVQAKIEATKAERAERRDFTIDRAGGVPSMRQVRSPAAEE